MLYMPGGGSRAVKNAVLWTLGKSSSASCSWFSRASVLSRADFDLADSWQILCTLQSAWLRQRSGAKWQSGHYGNMLSRPPPRSPRERDDGPFVSAAHRRDGPTRCLPVGLPSFLFNYEQVHLLPPAEPNPSPLMESIHHYPSRAEEHGLSMRYYVIVSRVIKRTARMTADVPQAQGQS